MTTQKRIKVLLSKPGLDGHDRGVKVIARGLRDAGMEIVYLGVHLTPQEIAEAAVQEDVDVIGLSCLSGAHKTLFPAVVKLAREKTDKNILFIGGGIIPEKDVPFLKNAGIRYVFGPGTTMAEIVASIKEGLNKNENHQN